MNLSNRKPANPQSFPRKLESMWLWRHASLDFRFRGNDDRVGDDGGSRLPVTLPPLTADQFRAEVRLRGNDGVEKCFGVRR